MNHRYENYIAGQEEPELMPNEIAYRLSALLGYDHFLIHRALVAANPELVVTAADWYLSTESLPSVLTRIEELLLKETMSCLPTNNFSTPCLTSATITVQ